MLFKLGRKLGAGKCSGDSSAKRWIITALGAVELTQGQCGERRGGGPEGSPENADITVSFGLMKFSLAELWT